jgi:hypothetical protein
MQVRRRGTFYRGLRTLSSLGVETDEEGSDGEDGERGNREEIVDSVFGKSEFGKFDVGGAKGMERVERLEDAKWK